MLPVAEAIAAGVRRVEAARRWGRWLNRRLRPIAVRVLNDGPIVEGDDVRGPTELAAEMRRVSLAVKAEALGDDGRFRYEAARSSAT